MKRQEIRAVARKPHNVTVIFYTMVSKCTETGLSSHLPRIELTDS